ncbi:hypothetical protein BV25DRAFT_1828502 [Artomyces pyxidatus]|uniref:Uncharacterized protein n=1 Tax=Artomyces pyxidatus TaxID=48021 RepID=A0ACB8SUC7_9AGAM|nr:hypothetical protein BV25DRAFT_1828502 [Artomyces pyxidatus]
MSPPPRLSTLLHQLYAKSNSTTPLLLTRRSRPPFPTYCQYGSLSLFLTRAIRRFPSTCYIPMLFSSIFTVPSDPVPAQQISEAWACL